MASWKHTNKTDKHKETQTNKRAKKYAPQPRDTFVDIIIFLLIIAVISGLVFFYWAMKL